MGRKVVLTEPAVEDLRDIVAYLAQDNPAAALRFGNLLLDHALALANFPFRGAAHGRRPTVRKLTIRGFKIYYHVPADREVVEILHFWHAARRDPPQSP